MDPLTLVSFGLIGFAFGSLMFGMFRGDSERLTRLRQIVNRMEFEQGRLAVLDAIRDGLQDASIDAAPASGRGEQGSAGRRSPIYAATPAPPIQRREYFERWT